MNMTADEAHMRAFQIAQELGNMLFNKIPGSETDDRALRSMTLGALLALVTTNQDKDFYSLLRMTVKHYSDFIEMVNQQLQEHMDECPGKVVH